MSALGRIPGSRLLVALLATLLVLPAGLILATAGASAATPPTINLRVLLIGGIGGSADSTTAAWAKALASEGVPYTEVDATGAAGSETVSLPALSSGSTANFNGIVIADSPNNFASGQLTGLFSYESTFGIRQVDGYMFPDPLRGATDVTAGALDGTTGTLTSAGVAALPELKGPIPFDSGTFGYTATATAAAPFTPWIDDAAGHALAGVYQHPSTDAQAGVSELSLFFNYNSDQLQWLLLAPGLINWVTSDTHLGLYRNYFGQDIDDNFIADNEWSSQFQCTPAATDPPDFSCPTADQGVAAGSAPGVPADVQMSAADVAYVVAWEKQTGITLNLAFNAIGACTADKAADESTAKCSGSITDNGGTFTDPGQKVNASYPNDAGLVNALLANQSSFNWINHTWSHLFLGCTTSSPQVLSTVTANSSGGTFTAGTYSYEVTAATAYGESEPSAPQSAVVAAAGSVALTWPEATNGAGADGTAGPSLAQEEASHTGGTGFWGYYVYREDPGATTYGLVGHVAENPAANAATTYSFTDTGATAGRVPNSDPASPTATNPGIDCASNPSGWLPATSASPDSSIEQEIGLNQAFAAANGLTNYTPAAVVTGEHSGIENPNMPAALAGTGVTTFAEDASRQPQQYSLGAALGAPRYPSNVYYNASNWPDELNEYNTLYVAQGASLGSANPAGETGHCASTSATTCVAAPLTEAGLLASESHIMLSHVLDNDPRVGYAHQSNLIGPATLSGQDYGYTILSLISNMLALYNSWYTAPLSQMTDVSEAQVLANQAAWAQAGSAGSVSASKTNGVVTITNSGSAVNVPVTMPTGTTVSGSAFGQSYGGQLSDWVNLATGATETIDLHVPPAFTSSASSTSIVGAPFTFKITTTGEPNPAVTEVGALPAGLTFTDNGDGTATIAGTAAAGSGGSYPFTLTATNASGSISQAFSLTNDEAPTITSPATALFLTGVAGTYNVTTTGFPAATITESGALPGGLSFAANSNGTATIAGTASTTGTYPVSLSAANASGSTATLALTITVSPPVTPAITSPASFVLTVGQVGSFAVTATGAPAPALTETGALPPGVTFKDDGNGTATLAGTPTHGSGGTYPLTLTALNSAGSATQTFTLSVDEGPTVTSAPSTGFSVGTAGAFTVTTTGFPAPLLSESGALPSGVTFKDNGNGTGTLAGAPAAGTGGSYALAITATNGSGPATQTFTLKVAQVPRITSAAQTNLSVGAAGTFNVMTSGYPAPAVTEKGALPAGVAFKDNGNGTATLAGTPGAGTAGTYHLTLTAKSPSGSVIQNYTLTVSLAVFIPRPGGATDIGVGANGSVWIVGTNRVSGGYGIYRWNGKAWTAVAGGAVRIAVDRTGNPWVVNSAHHIYHWTGRSWAGYPGAATDVGVGANGSVWIVGAHPVAGGYGIYRWNGRAWAALPGAAVRIAVDQGGNAWVVNSAHHISHWTGRSWAGYPGAATDVGVGANGSVWIVGANPVAGGYGIYHWNGKGWTAVRGGAVGISVDPRGNPWIVNSAHHLYSS